MRNMIIAALLLCSCSTKELNLNPKMRLRTSEAPLSLIQRHDDLKATLKLKFDLEYPASFQGEKNQPQRNRLLENGVALAIKTIYLMGLTMKPIDVSDYRTSGCKAYKVKKMHLVCANVDNPKAWVPGKNLQTLSEFYWTSRFHEDFLQDMSEKFGVYLRFKSERSSDLELIPLEANEAGTTNSNEISFKISRLHLSPNQQFPQFHLKILEQRHPTIELGLALSYFATKKSEGFLAPITQLSPDFEEIKTKNVVLIKTEQADEVIKRIKELVLQNNLTQHRYCPLNLNYCDYPNRIDYKDEKKVHDYIFDQSFRNHIWGLLLLAHTKIEHLPLNKQKVQILVTLDMNTLMTTYKLMPIRAYRELIEK